MRSWDELIALGEAASRDEALAVATAMMRTVARNADVLVERLRARGWPVERHARMPPGRLTSTRNAFTGEPRVQTFDDLERSASLEALITELTDGLEPF